MISTGRIHMPLFLNFLAFFLPMASADGVFRDYASLTEILDLADDSFRQRLSVTEWRS
jgi:hypothetical protein